MTDQNVLPPLKRSRIMVITIIVANIFIFYLGNGTLYYLKIYSSLGFIYSFLPNSYIQITAFYISGVLGFFLRVSKNLLYELTAKQERRAVKARVITNSETKWLNKAYVIVVHTPKMDPETVNGRVIITKFVSMRFLLPSAVLLPQLERIEATEPPIKKIQVMAILVLVQIPSPMMRQMLMIGPPPMPAAQFM